jgi:hypothetical protein
MILICQHESWSFWENLIKKSILRFFFNNLLKKGSKFQTKETKSYPQTKERVSRRFTRVYDAIVKWFISPLEGCEDNEWAGDPI